MAKKDKGSGDATFPTSSPAARAKVGPGEIQQKEFRVAKLRTGYEMRDVDEFLDAITESMTALTAENQRLRSGAPVAAAPDLEDAARQADEIIQRARAEAARIVAQAQGGDGAPADRAAVDAFLTNERAFLQSLAGLMQGHAETVKSMARSARSASPAPVAAAPEPQASEATEAPASAPAPEPAAEPEPEPEVAQAQTQVQEPVRIGEPEPAAVARVEGDEEPEGDRSLRDLFWGED